MENFGNLEQFTLYEEERKKKKKKEEHNEFVLYSFVRLDRKIILECGFVALYTK